MSVESLQILIEAIDQASKPIQQVAQSIEKLNQLSGNLKNLGQGITSIGQGMTAGVTAPIIAGLGEAARVAIEFESAMADVNKAYGFEAGTAQALQAESAVKTLAVELGRLPTDVAAIGTEAGKLGVQFDQFEDYTSLVTKASVAFDMSAQQTGESIGVLTNVLGYMDANNRVNIQGLERLGDTINYLADSGATSESAIINVLQRSGGIQKSFGLASEESAGLAAAFLNLGYPPEVVGTAINGMLPKLQNATQQTGDFQKALEQIGLPAEQFEQLVKKDAVGAIDTLLTAIDKSGDSSIIGRMFGTGSDSAMLTTAVENLDRFRSTMDSINKAPAGGMMDTFAKRSQTTAAQLEKLRASTYILRNELGAALLPIVNQVVGALIPMAQNLAKFVEANPGITKVALGIGMVAAAIGPALMAIGSLVQGAAGLVNALKLVKTAMLFLSPQAMQGLTMLKSFFTGAAFSAAALGAILAGVVFGIFKIGGAIFGVNVTWQDFINVIKLSLAELPANLAQVPAAISAIFSAIGLIIRDRLQMAVQAAGMAFQALVTRIQAVFSQARAAAAAGVQGVVGAIRSGAAAAVAAVASMGQQIIARIRAIAAGAFSAGAEIIARLAAGIRSRVGAVVSAISSVANAVKSALPGSPVKTGELRVLNNIANNPGAEISRMVASGISAGAPAVQAAMATLGDQALKGTPTGQVGQNLATGIQTPARADGGGGTTNITIQISGVTNAQDAEGIGNVLREQLNRVMDDRDRNQARVSYS